MAGKTNTKGSAKENKSVEETPEQTLKNISKLSSQLNETYNYVNEYRRQGLKANANDMMVLYKVVSEYEKKISNFLARPEKHTGSNNTAQKADLVGRREDARENKRNLANVISDSMDEIKLDVKGFKSRLNEKLTEKDRKREETKELLEALSNYQYFDRDAERTVRNKRERADAKQRLVNACIGYVKKSNNKDAKDVVYDIAAVMGKQNITAFNNLKDEDLKAMSTRRYLGYRTNTVGDYKTHYLGNSIGPNELDKSGIVEKLGPDSDLTQQQKDEEFDKYMSNLYANDRFASFSKKQHEQVDKELGKDASEKARRQRLGELAYKEAPWNKIKLDDTTKSKEAFAHRQKVMRQWFPDDAKLLYGSTLERNTARKYYDVLNNGTYNGFVRSLKNSPEYTALMKSLKKYTKNAETNVIKDEQNLRDVKNACVKYLERYDNKKEKSEFAMMRCEKVKELLDSLGGATKKAEKRTEKAVEKEVAKKVSEKKRVGTRINYKEIEEPKKEIAKVRKFNKTMHKDFSLGI